MGSSELTLINSQRRWNHRRAPEQYAYQPSPNPIPTPISIVQLVDASTLKKEVAEGVDLMVVRELTGGCWIRINQQQRQLLLLLRRMNLLSLKERINEIVHPRIFIIPHPLHCKSVIV
ncbi:putative 3-isopropylmalate dehydrogenase [Helianthus annuus]|uniref:3-isopropylmalate dehydrogenase n=1 Tax=Helianthus annuus TaxID=4232 RepID=A0A251UU43_HELAN|nr:putative 3-isopropylmalate dehydrogenase [Helianthus annuus]KAJ0579151.1 putative 3-isopropylmalate dehydrogenase [Helianthus annuus]KAJ0920976.1 putative 3-isopropylmalate dehydrogenase [Helianthus annuus]KAJ0924564.1 putative 3-isopropylmalate dehydrogenase [Helianthus annuus]